MVCVVAVGTSVAAGGTTAGSVAAGTSVAGAHVPSRSESASAASSASFTGVLVSDQRIAARGIQPSLLAESEMKNQRLSLLFARIVISPSATLTVLWVPALSAQDCRSALDAACSVRSTITGASVTGTSVGTSVATVVGMLFNAFCNAGTPKTAQRLTRTMAAMSSQITGETFFLAGRTFRLNVLLVIGAFILS